MLVQPCLCRAVIIEDGVYVLQNKATKTVLELAAGGTAEGTQARAWKATPDTNQYLDQNWLIRRVPGQSWYTIMNVKSGTNLDLFCGKGDNNTKIAGYHAHNGIMQTWYFFGSPETGFAIVNVAGGSVVDLDGGKANDGTIVFGYKFHGGDNQLWIPQLRSVQNDKISSILTASPSIHRDFKHFPGDRFYIIPPTGAVGTVHAARELDIKKGKYKWRADSFDCDNFALGLKGDVTFWTYDNVRAPVGLLFGVIYGIKSDKKGHACNWTLSQDLQNVVFFEPQTGEWSQKAEYHAYFGLY